MKTIIVATSAMVFSVMQTAIAQTGTAPEAVPYTITFDGAVYPAALETIDYPYNKARLNQSGSCMLNVFVDDAKHIAAMSVDRCSDDGFRREAEAFVNDQALTGSTEGNLQAHRLEIVWEMDPQPDAPFTLAGIE